MHIIRTGIVWFFWLAVTVSYGQVAKKYEKYSSKYNYRSGYIITKRGVKIEGLIKDLTGELQKHKRVVFVSKEGQKSTYYPSGIAEYGLSSKRYVSNGSNFFELVYETKAITLYKLRYAISGYGGNSASYLSSSYYVKRTSEHKFVEIRRMGFRKNLRNYFSDCPLLQEKIENKELTHKDAMKIVKFYQSQCTR